MEFKKDFTTGEKSQGVLTITISQADVSDHYRKLTEKYAKQVQLPGFRRGKVPVSILEQKYGDALKADAANELVEQSLQSFFEEANEFERPLPYSQPVAESTPDLCPDKDFSFTVRYDVFPKIAVAAFEGMEWTAAKVSVTKEDIDEELARLQQKNAFVIDRNADALVETGNVATINYEEIGEDESHIPGTKREDFVFTVGSGENIYKIDDEIIGMKKGETRTVEKTYPEDFADTELAGKTKKIAVTLTALKLQEVPALDDDFAQDIDEKFKTLDDLINYIRTAIEREVTHKQRSLKIEAVLAHILKDLSIDVPESMLAAELNSRWDMMARRFGMSREQLDEMAQNNSLFNKAETFDSWRTESEALLKKRILVETLLHEGEFSVTDTDIDDHFSSLAAEHNIDIERIKETYDSPANRDSMIESLKENKLYDLLLEKLTVKEGAPLTASEFLKQQDTASQEESA